MCNQEIKEGEEDTEHGDFEQKWIEFLADAEKNKNFHRYSPEKNGVTRMDAKLSPHPNADKEAYRKLKQNLKRGDKNDSSAKIQDYIDHLLNAASIEDFESRVAETKLIAGEEKTCLIIKKVFMAMAKVYSKTPSISRSNAVYNTNLPFPCFEALIEMMKKNVSRLYYVPGENDLEVMTKQLKEMRIMKSLRDDYQSIVHRKVAFDNSKGMFALLAMLKTIADRYKHAPVEKFAEIKLYFVQPSGFYLRLWSMKYAKKGLYNFVREDKILLSDDFATRKERLSSLFNFFLNLKSRLEETASQVAELEKEHEENESNFDSEGNSQTVTLSDIICPKIFKISYSNHGQNFCKEHLQSSPDSDY